MRDPLSSLPIKYKLPCTFLIVSLIALAVGGYLVSHFAGNALEHEIALRMRIDAQSRAREIEAARNLLGRRLQDFASDGLIRGLLAAALDDRSDLAVRRRLGEHLRSNKTPLVHSFIECSVWGPDPVCFASSREHGSPARDATVEAAFKADGLYFGDFVPETSVDPFPTFGIAATVRSLDGSRELGRIVAWVHMTRFLAEAMRHATEDDGTGLVLTDRSRRELVIPRWIGTPTGGTPAAAAHGVGLVLRDAGEGVGGRPSEHLSHTCSLGDGEWSARVETDARAAMEPIRTLESRYLGAGLTTLIVGLGAMFVSVWFIVVPLGRLRSAAVRLEDGDLEARVAVESRDEIGELGRAFNAMAASISQRTRELESKRDELNAVVGAMSDGLCLIDREQRVVLSNAAALPLVKALRNEEGALARQGCKKGEACTQCFSKPGTLNCEIEIDTHHYEVIASDLTVDTAPGGRLLVARDVTERIQMAERQAFHERMTVVGEVAAVVAHEINNPLASISMFNQMMEDELPADSPYHEHCEVIARNTAACKRAIRDLLDSVHSGVSHHDAVDMRDVVEDTARFLSPVARRNGTTIDLATGGEEAIIVVDEVRLRQALVNLVLNGIQATPGGRIRLEVGIVGTSARVTIEDDGCGIDEDVLEHIFDPFFTTKRPGEGTGLGLPTARRTVEELGGHLKLDATGPGGTRFRVDVPLRAPSSLSEEDAHVATE